MCETLFARARCYAPPTLQVNLLGMMLGYYLVQAISGSGASGQYLAWVAFWALMCLHIVCNLRAMRCLRLRTLNRERFRAVMEGWKATVQEEDPVGEGAARRIREEENGNKRKISAGSRDLMSIKAAAEKERIVLPLFTSFLFTPRIRLGCRLSDVVRALSALDGNHCSFASFAVEHRPLRIRGVGKPGKASSSALLAVLRFVRDADGILRSFFSFALFIDIVVFSHFSRFLALIL